MPTAGTRKAPAPRRGKSPASRVPRHLGSTYLSFTHRPLHCLIFILPPLLFYHLGTAALGSRLTPSARGDLLDALAMFGVTGRYLAPAAIAAVLVAQHLARGDDWRIRPRVLAGMAGESVLWTLPLLAMGLLRGQLQAAAVTAGGGHSALAQICADVGAGVYEEFVFRLILISVLAIVFVDVLGLKEGWVLTGAVLLSAVLFALYHPQVRGPHLAMGPFFMLFAAGVLWGGLYVFRGFGIAVGSHVAWDLWYHLFKWLWG